MANLLFDRWLRFAPVIEERYEAEHGAERIAAVRLAAYVGLGFYNIYNLTSMALLRDVAWFSVELRILLITPATLGLAWLIGRIGPSAREALVTVGAVNALMLPVFLFWLSRDPLSSYTFGDLALNLVFGNMLLVLRFRHATIFTVIALCITCVAIYAKPGLVAAQQFAFIIQVVTACGLTLYANYRVERRRCLDYLSSFNAGLRADAAEFAQEAFRDLSKTDALTGLPNRRLLDERLAEWLEDREPLALMMIDIDHFKLFNDALGHPAGDECLVKVGEVFAGLAAEQGVFCARYGGEEFTLFARNLSELDTARLANALVRSVEALAILHPGRMDGAGVVTVSVGVVLKAHDISMAQDALFSAADQALYEAKRQGRNRYVLTGSVDAEHLRIA